MKAIRSVLLLIIISFLIHTNSFAQTLEDQIFYVKNSVLNLRNGPGTDFIIEAKLYKSQKVKLIAKYDDNWWRVEVIGSDLNKVEGYVNGKYLGIPNEVEIDEGWNIFVKYGVEKETLIYVLGFILFAILFIIIIALPKKVEKNEIPVGQNVKEEMPLGIVNQQQNQTKVIVIKSTKSVGLAIFLSIIFPYFGVLYSTVSGFFWLFFSYLGMWGVLFYWGLTTFNDGVLYLGFFLSMLHWLISIIWSGIAASNYNKRIIS